MLTCRHASRLLSKRLDQPLSCFESLAIGVHLLVCPPCRRWNKAVGFLHGELASAPNDVQLPSAARERIWLALERAERSE